MNYTLNKLLDIPSLRELLDSLYEISIIPSAVLDIEGNILIASAWQDICTKFHRVNPDTKKMCLESDLRLTAGLGEKTSINFYVCPMGLRDAVAPIVIEGNHLGNVYVGQFFLEQPDETAFREQARQYGYPESEYVEALRKVPVFSEEQFRPKLDFIVKLTQMLAEQGLQLHRRCEAEEARRESEERSRSIFEESLDAIFITSPDGAVMDANPAACNIFGMTVQEICQAGRAGIVDTSDPRFVSGLEERKRTGRVNTELTCIRKNGERFEAEVSSVITPMNPQRSFVMIRDLTEQKKIEKALHDSEEQFRTLCEAAPIGIFRSDCDGDANYVNPRWVEITGIPASEGKGKGWVKGIHPDDLGELGKIWAEAKAEGRIFSYEHRQVTPQGKTIWVRALASPIYGPDGTISHVGTLEDITEIRQARQEMLKTVKLESLGVLAGGIAHDFNNVLTAVFGNISLARFQLHDSEAVNKRLDDAEKAIVRAADLTKQLLTFARGGEPIKKIIKLNSLLQEAVRLVHGSNVELEFDLEDDIGPVEVDEGQFAQVIHNLVLNAVQAMPQGGKLTIRANNISSPSNGNRSVYISLADTGAGISENILQRIFDPYFTTKPQGNGLGLATCYSIIKRHGGEISVESTVGEGTKFTISLQASAHECESVPESLTTLCHGSGRVLVMDDNEDIRTTAQAILKELGYTVELAEDGAEAVEIYSQGKEQGLPFSAVILDLTVPAGMGGKETIQNLLKIDPAVKAIVSSGYSNDPIMASYGEYGFRAVLTKPYRPQEMSKVLRDLIDS